LRLPDSARPAAVNAVDFAGRIVAIDTFRRMSQTEASRRNVMKRTLIYTAVFASLLPAAGIAYGADQDADRDRDQLQTQDRDMARNRDQVQGKPVHGRQLMTEQERNAFRARMRAAKSVEERERIRNEHHERMMERAREKGVTLPDKPPMRGMGGGMGPPRAGSGPGGGMGPGGGARR
jgi:hypothetical protein